jgi:hypothetical protein
MKLHKLFSMGIFIFFFTGCNLLDSENDLKSSSVPVNSKASFEPSPLNIPLANALTPPAEVFRALLPQLRKSTGVSILLPSTLPILRQPIYASATGDRSSYSIRLSSVSHCTANACSIGNFEAKRGAQTSFVQTVPLTQNLKGYYKPLSCGASCSPPAIAWVNNGVRYEVQLSFPSRDKEIVKKALVQIANSAIMAGPR